MFTIVWIKFYKWMWTAVGAVENIPTHVYLMSYWNYKSIYFIRLSSDRFKYNYNPWLISEALRTKQTKYGTNSSSDDAKSKHSP